MNEEIKDRIKFNHEQITAIVIIITMTQVHCIE